MCRVFKYMSVYVWIYIFRAYFCDLVVGGGGGGGGEGVETGVQPMQSALICYLFEPICK